MTFNVHCFNRFSNDLNITIKFNKIYNVEFPNNTTNIIFGDEFNQPLNKVKWPESLKCVVFGKRFNQTLEKVILPDSVITIIFLGCYNQSLDYVKWPKLLKELFFDDKRFNQPLNFLPESLNLLQFHFRNNNKSKILRESQNIPRYTKVKWGY
ncbi:IP22 [Cafeteriavirus-dependent mavirus]|uniref:FNIP repeat-containing protein n=2 Tax=Cafeteriavirus-dependent mavirus TaxID=1932923 RepID=F1DAU1_9VIRU|nr:hypothetical protein Mvrk_gpp20 [Maverick-related virus strain Spezl]ADZ16419.1 hypothetical protein [Maverick-related virus strain Spezl]API81737.1 hypothetical protein Mvrk_gpp20 [Cafeteriavirus-dependent mavirus]CAI9421425.1 IP22 [Cafeteriavirus-dependent mavirus]CAJ0990547.1 IP22 [Cafeteriavirus-dependent mavirus]|tara:strand:- start:266 stop:724 length:459 start_codon:yes stop_codon:yes gene_type:complete